MLLSFGYDKTTLQYNLPDENLLGVLLPNETPAALTGEAEVKRALQNPIGTPRLSEIVRPGEKIAIVTSDITRPMPTYAVLPHVAEELALAGVRDEDVTIVFALGIHREMTPEEMRKAAGEEMFSRFACLNASKDYTHLGVSQNGTPVDIFTPVAKADRIICLGNIEYHYFAGYSGGSKAIMPGVSTHDAIQANHKRMVDERAHAGDLDTNPSARKASSIASSSVAKGSKWILRTKSASRLLTKRMRHFSSTIAIAAALWPPSSNSRLMWSIMSRLFSWPSIHFSNVASPKPSPAAASQTITPPSRTACLALSSAFCAW